MLYFIFQGNKRKRILQVPGYDVTITSGKVCVRMRLKGVKDFDNTLNV
jgi:hypothetical protein